MEKLFRIILLLIAISINTASLKAEAEEDLFVEEAIRFHQMQDDLYASELCFRDSDSISSIKIFERAVYLTFKTCIYSIEPNSFSNPTFRRRKIAEWVVSPSAVFPGIFASFHIFKKQNRYFAIKLSGPFPDREGESIC